MVAVVLGTDLNANRLFELNAITFPKTCPMENFALLLKTDRRLLLNTNLIDHPPLKCDKLIVMEIPPSDLNKSIRLFHYFIWGMVGSTPPQIINFHNAGNNK